MIDPPMPAHGFSVLTWCKTMWNFVRAIRPRAGSGITLIETSSGTIICANPVKHPEQMGPFTPIFRAISTDPLDLSTYTYKVKVNRGYVVDHVTGGSSGFDALATWICSNQYETDGTLHEFSIMDGQAVYVSVTVDASGAISACAIYIGTQSEVSSHYVPAVGDDTYGSGGTYLYKLADFNLDSNHCFDIKLCLAGDHVPHYRDLPIIKKGVDGGEDIFQKYDPGADRYTTYGLAPSTATGQIPVTLTKEAGLIKFGVPKSDITALITGSGGTGALKVVIYGTGTTHTLMEWTNGIITSAGDKVMTFDTLAGGGKLIAVSP